MKKITALITAIALAISLSSCSKDELPTPNPSPPLSDTVQNPTNNQNIIIYKVYGSNPNISFNVSGYNTAEGIVGIDNYTQGVWSDTIRYTKGTQLDFGLSLTFNIHLFISSPGCPPPPPNYEGQVTGEIWYNGQLVATTTLSTDNPNEQGDCFYTLP